MSATILRPDFEKNATKRFLEGYELLALYWDGYPLSPEQMAQATRAAYTHQRRLNAALALGYTMADDYEVFCGDGYP